MDKIDDFGITYMNLEEVYFDEDGNGEYIYKIKSDRDDLIKKMLKLLVGK